MEVFVVLAGFDYEGSTILGIYHKREDALDYLLSKQMGEDENGWHYDWARIDTHVAK